VELLNYYGRPFYPNTSKSVLSGKSFTHQDKKYSSRIGSLKSDRWKDEKSPTFTAAITQNVHTNGLYESRPVSTLTGLKGAIWIRRVSLREKLRKVLLHLLGNFGFNISRKKI
jgi:hypothetical protein